MVTAVEPWLQSPAVGAEARMFAIGSLEQAATALEALHRPAEAIAPLERARSLAPGQHHGAIDARIARLRESAGGK